jgi:hypothetical protein
VWVVFFSPALEILMFQLHKKLLSRLFKTRSSKKRTRVNRNRVLLREHLELRSLMAADIALVNGILTMNVDPAGTNAQVVVANPGNPFTVVQVFTTSPNGNANLAVAKNTLVSIRYNGSDQVDRFTNSTSYRSVVYGYGGADILQGGSNFDTISGQNGEDVIRGGGGNDHLFGGNDSDVIEGQAGNDLIYGQNGNDHLFGGTGDDNLYGGGGMDGLFGDSGLDRFEGGSGGDRYLNDTSEGMQFFADFSTEDVQQAMYQAIVLVRTANGPTPTALRLPVTTGRPTPMKISLPPWRLTSWTTTIVQTRTATSMTLDGNGSHNT